MRRFNEKRNVHTPDEIWLCEHEPVYTLGQNADPSHVLEPVSIPVIKTDRGGQVTWHGPGQLIAYTLIDLRRKHIGIKTLVHSLETAVMNFLKCYGLRGETMENAPGVYVDGKKIASVGLRVSKNCSYHGLSLNVNPDLTFFASINPCGYPGLTVTSLLSLGINTTPDQIAPALSLALMNCLGYQKVVQPDALETNIRYPGSLEITQ